MNTTKKTVLLHACLLFLEDEKLTIFIKSNNFKKYAAACKLTHELGANIQEEFKGFNERVAERKFNGFRIKKVEKMADYETTLMFKTRKGLEVQQSAKSETESALGSKTSGIEIENKREENNS